MKRSVVIMLVVAFAMVATSCSPDSSQPEMEGEGWTPLFTGENLSNWTLKSEKASEIWSVKDGVIDCEPRIHPRGVEKDLWTKDSFGDFKLHIEWRFKETKPGFPVRLLNEDGTYKRDENGEVITREQENADSGIYLRGSTKAQINIWNWPAGSGEIWGYRTDEDMPSEVRAGATPNVHADKPIGEWNTFVITARGDTVTVELNGKTVIDHVRLPGLPEKGPIALQHHGGYNQETGEWSAASSLIQFRNIYIKEL